MNAKAGYASLAVTLAGIAAWFGGGIIGRAGVSPMASADAIEAALLAGPICKSEPKDKASVSQTRIAANDAAAGVNRSVPQSTATTDASAKLAGLENYDSKARTTHTQADVHNPSHKHDHVTNETARQPSMSARKVLYYRNPMGLPDISSVPKKDEMGMDYVPVFAEDGGSEGGAVQLSAGRIQRTGVQTRTVESREMSSPVRASGVVSYDETRLTVVSSGVEGIAEQVYASHVGHAVRQGQPLFRISSNSSQMLQIEIARQNRIAGKTGDSSAQALFTGTTNVSAADWPSPASGVVIEKRLINGQRIGMGEELFRIADMSQMWVIADVAEIDVGALKPGMRAKVRPRAYPGETIEGSVRFVYPALRAETRTARVCIDVPNQQGRLKPEMYADVLLVPESRHVLAVPDSAVIDDGVERHVLLALGEGRFEPRKVNVGMRADGHTEVLEGLAAGDSVVTSAAFLIDAESKLQAAFTALANARGKP